ncbi:hypothetical protein JCM1841_001967 [Sporobolomyces salmonicolor]
MTPSSSKAPIPRLARSIPSLAYADPAPLRSAFPSSATAPDHDVAMFDAYTFRRTPALRLDIPLDQQQNLALSAQSDRPQLEHRPSTVSSAPGSISADSFSALPFPARPYALPPGLANSPAPSLVPVSKRRVVGARSARVTYEPPIPVEVQWLLLTTPHPRRTKPTVAAVTHPPVRSQEDDGREEEKTGLVRRLFGLKIGGGKRPLRDEGELVIPPPAVPQTEVLDLRARRRGKVDRNSTELPRSWKEYEVLYASGQLDIEDPPLPPITTPFVSQTFPSRSASGPMASPFANMSPYDLSHFPAPIHLSPISQIRERLIANLDLLGLSLPNLPAADTIVSTPASATNLSQFPSPSVSHASAPMSVVSSASTRRDSFLQSVSHNGHACPATGRRDSTVSTAPSTVYSGPRPSSKIASATITPQQTHSILRSMKEHPTLVGIVRRLCAAKLGEPSPFSPPPKAATITLFPSTSSFPGDTRTNLTVLASHGLPDEDREFTLADALDAHTILNGSRGLVISDTEQDWRWRGNRDAVDDKGIRFYAGMPIFAPSALSLSLPTSSLSVAEFEEEAGGARIAIGVVALLDDRPKLADEFDSAERAKLRSLASEITTEVERFVLERASVLVAGPYRRDSSASTTSTSAATAAANYHSGVVAPMPVHHEDVAPPSLKTLLPRGHVKKVSSDTGPTGPQPLSGKTSQNGYLDYNSTPSSQFHTEPSSSQPSPTTFPALLASHEPSQLLRLACTSLSRSLSLALVYIVELDLASVDPAPSMDGAPPLELLAAHNLPRESGAAFDPSLHFRALRAPEGGLLYRSPVEGERDSDAAFTSGILLPVKEIGGDGTVASARKGWVLAGYTRDPKKRWGEGEMEAFERVREGVAKVLLWREKTLVAGRS